MIANTWHFLLVSVEGVRSPSAYTVMFFFCWIRSIYWKCLQVYGSVCKTATIKSWMDGSMHDERARFFFINRSGRFVRQRYGATQHNTLRYY